MLGLLDLLRSLTGLLRCVGGDDIPLYRLRVWLAAQLILDNPGLVPFDNSGHDDDYIAAAEEGERLADELRGAGKRVAVVEAEGYVEDAPANRREEAIGPFWTGDRRLVRFDVHVATTADWVGIDLAQPPVGPETLLLLPAATARAADGASLSVPAGTVWIAARLLDAGGPPRRVGLRVIGGEVRVPGGLPELPTDGHWLLAAGDPWTARFLPEQPEAAGAGELGFRLPDVLVLGSDGAARLEGVAALVRDGSAIDLPLAGAPAATAEGIRVPLAAGGVEVQTGGPAPEPLRLRGRYRLAAAAWVLAYGVPTGLAGDAADGGALLLDLADGDGGGAVDGTGLVLAWAAGKLRLSARRRSWQVAQATGFGTLEIAAWRGARCRLGVGAGAKPVIVAWTPDGEISLRVGAGSLATALDLPLAADGKPFDLSPSTVAAWGFARRADGSWLTTLDGVVPEAVVRQLPRRGYALRNLYVYVRGPQRLLAGGTGARLGAIEDGAAWLTLESLAAEPMLPNPYASNWRAPLRQDEGSAPLDVTLRWTDAARPVMATAFAQMPGWPVPSNAHDQRVAVDLEFQDRLRDATRAQIEVGDGLKLIDLSSAAQRFGIEIDRFALGEARLGADSQLALPMRNARLFLLPQVQWEPVRNLNLDAAGQVIRARSQGMPAFAGAAAEEPVRALPEEVASRIVRAQRDGDQAAALFSLPFGLRAYTDLGPDRTQEGPRPARIEEHRARFADGTDGATQLRLEALDRDGPGERPLGEARGMLGAMAPVTPPGDPVDVLPGDVRQMVQDSFGRAVPLHRVDLSGYGLSCFSRWRFDPPPDEDFLGVVQVRFDVMVGRTAYEVIELRSYLVCPQSRMVRTIVIERTNAGIVERFDTGWKAIEDGTFDRFVAFETGLVRRFTGIRNVTILDRPSLSFPDPAPPAGQPPALWTWEAVRYDADAHLGDKGETIVPIRGHLGYIPIAPVAKPIAGQPGNKLTPAVLRALFEKSGGPIGGSADAQLLVGATLPLHVTGIQADRAKVPGPGLGFVVSVTGAPALPRVGRWNAVRVSADGNASAVDPTRGLPVIRAPGSTPYRLSEPADAYSPDGDRFGFLLDLDGSRLLFPQPTIDPGEPGRVSTAEPELADAYSLSQAAGLLPPRARRLLADRTAKFALEEGSDWELLTTDLEVKLQETALAGTAKWQMSRALEAGRKGLGILLDTGASALKVERAGTDSIDLALPGFPAPLLSLVGSFAAELGKGPESRKPDVRFGDALAQLKEIVDALASFTQMPLPFDIDVNAAPGPTPAFDVRLRLRLRVPGGQNERIDIGVGKFCGRFEATGQLRAALSGPAQGRLQLAFEGDLQQGIIPPVLYAGGYFRFAVTIRDDADPLVELGLATTASIGGDLIPGLIELEVTVRYGYTLIPETLEPGVLLGLEARAKLLSGLLGVSFRVDVLARIKRLDVNGLPDAHSPTVTIFAEIKVVATVEVLWGLADDERELQTQFEQKLPLALFAVAAAGNPLFAATELL